MGFWGFGVSKVSLEAEEAVEAEDDFITLQVGCTLFS